MNSFQVCREIEKRAMQELMPFVEAKAHRGRFVLTDKGNLSEFLQKTVGDIIINCQDEKVWGIEVKAEEEHKTGNLFLETWSNRGMGREGWYHTLSADILWYYFLDCKILYSVSFHKLKEWGQSRLEDFPEKAQTKYVQLNDAYGRCVPVWVLQREVGLKRVNMTKWKLQKAREEKTCYWCDLHNKRGVPATFLVRWQFADEVGEQMAPACDTHMIQKSPYALGLEAL